MNELHTMPLKVEKFLSSRRVRGMALDEVGAYLLLLMECWLDGGSIPENEARDALAAHGVDEQAWKRLKVRVVDRMFTAGEDGRITNATLSEIYSETSLRLQRKREGGKLGSSRRWHSNDSPNGSPKAEPCREDMPAKAKPKAKEKEKAEDKRFVPPTVEQVREHCPAIDAEAFVAFYQSKGWKVGNQPMKSWQAATVTWRKRHDEQGASQGSKVLKTDTDYDSLFNR